ncbi:hypothetical protein SCLCIDRAFT_59390, partial [Scleroderma citrinum Foug A]
EYWDYLDAFSKTKSECMPLRKPWDHGIDLKEDFPPKKGQLIPLLVDKQKEDYHYLNEWTIKNNYLLPLILQLVDKLKGCKLFTKMDLWWGYNNVGICEGDEWKAVFTTHKGSYEWQVMPFSHTNAPAAFQQFVNLVFADMLNVCVVVYLDDILIYSDNMEDHVKHVQEVLRRLHQHKLFAKPKKCEFHSDSVEYLAYFLSPNSLTMLQDKVTTICDWPEPCKVKDIQSFLGFANFY